MRIKIGQTLLLLLFFSANVILCQHDNYGNGLSSRKLIRKKETSLSLHDHTHIRMIDVKCDADNGIIVTIDFEQPFNGIIYSQGYYTDPNCRYVQPGGNEVRYTFTVPTNNCGSKPSCSLCASIDNILVIQSEEDVQEIWDTARKITCSRSDEQEKTIIFKPFVVDMLEVVNVPTQTGGVECWMDIKIGEYPDLSPISGIVRIGDKLTVVVYLRDEKKEYDIAVRDCYAFDNENFNDKSTKKLQLSDNNGCSRKKKLFGSWKKSSTVRDSTATLAAYNTISAFKFPDKMQVFLKCDIEICRQQCEVTDCGESKTTSLIHTIQSNSYTFSEENKWKIDRQDAVTNTNSEHEIYEEECFPESQNPKCIKMSKSNENMQTTTCLPGTNNQQCQTSISASKTTTQKSFTKPLECELGLEGSPCTRVTEQNCNPDSTDPNCDTFTYQKQQITEQNLIIREENIDIRSGCYPGSADPNCAEPVEPSKPKSACYPGSSDPKCARPTYLPPDTSTQRYSVETGKTDKCTPGSTAPGCISYTSPSYTTTSRPQTTFSTLCYPGSPDPKCAKTTITQNTGCYPGSPDPNCVKPLTPSKPKSVCYPGSSDPKCTRPTYLPPDTSTQRYSVEPGKTDKCTPGSTAPECISYTSPSYTTTSRPRTTFPTSCYPGSTDSKCTKTTVTQKTGCYPGSPDPNCVKLVTPSKPKSACYPGSSDPKCARPTYLPPDTSTQRYSVEPGKTDKCTPGSTAPECISYTSPSYTTTSRPRTTFPTSCYPGSTDSKCTKTTVTQKTGCYPGSPDPNCVKLVTPSKPKSACYPGSSDPKCARPTYLPPDTSTQRYSVEPGKTDKCTPGSTAPECISYTSPSYTTTSRPRTTFPTSCYPGSPDPKCAKTTITQNTGCYPGSPDPNCVKPLTPSKPKSVCYPGSSDPKCARPTYLPPDTSTQRYSVEPGKTDQCTPGSTAPECITYTSPVYTTTSRPQTTFSTSCYPGSPDPKCAKTSVTQKTGCYPGSSDPNCVKAVTPSKPKSGCYPGSSDPKCTRPTYLPPDTSTQRYSVKPGKTDKCTPGSTAPECISYTSPLYTTTTRPQTTFSISCYPGSPDPKCAKTTVTQKTGCYPGSPDPNCVKPVTPSKPKSACYPGSSDPKCARPTYLPPDTSTQRYSVEPGKTDKCTPGSTAPGCISYTSPLYTTTSRPQTTFSTSCYPGSPDPNCAKTTVTQKTGCYPGSPDQNCVKPVTPSKPKSGCYPGSSDPKCARPTYLPPDTSTQRYSVEPKKPDKCTPGSTAPGCISYTSPSYTTTSRPQTTFSTSCYPGSPDPKCAKTTLTHKNGCYPGSSDPNCVKPVTPSKPKPTCYPGSRDPKCARPTYLPPDTSTQRYSVEPGKTDKCTPGSTAPECITYTSPVYTTTSRPQTTFSTSCYPGSPDPKCAKTTVTQKTGCYPGSSDPNCVKAVTPSKPKSACYPGSSDPKCTRPTYLPPDTSTQKYSVEPGKTDQCTLGSTAPECITYTSPVYTTTSRPQTTFSTSCYPGSPDPKCAKTTVTQKTGCYPGSPDPNCVKPVTPSKPKSACYPGSSDPKCARPTYLPPDTSTQKYSVEPGKTDQCTPGSTAPECITYTSPVYTTTSRPQTTFSTSCYPGSPDPKCAKTTVTQKTGCYPGSSDPNCVKAVAPSKPKSACYPGSSDPKCTRPIYLPPDTSTQRYSVEPGKTDKCTPGSTAPECISYTSPLYTTSSRPQTTFSTSCYPGSPDPKCAKTSLTHKNGCYPGSSDPNCVKPVTPSKPKPACYPGSRDPKCARPTYLPPDTSTQRYSVEPGKTDKCTPGSTAPGCISYTSPLYTTTSRPQTTFSKSCYPGSPDPNCAKTTVTQKTGCYPGSPDQNCVKPVTPSKPKSGCYPGSSDPKCARPTYLPPDTSTQRYSVEPKKPDKCTPGSTAPGCISYTSPSYTTTSRPQTTFSTSCYPGSPDPKCAKTTLIHKNGCYPGSPNPNCVKPVTSSKPKPACYPGSSDPKCARPTYLPPDTSTQRYTVEPGKTDKCSPGSTAPGCISYTSPSYTTTSRPQTTFSTSCYPGSPDPKCAKTTVTQKTGCYPGSPDPNCVKPLTPSKPKSACYPGSSDPKCSRPTYLPPDTSTQRFSVEPKKPDKCTPGSTAPGCISYTSPSYTTTSRPQTTFSTSCYPGSPDPKCAKTTVTQKTGCYPGSPDPNCVKPLTPSKPKSACYPGSSDPKCSRPTYLPPVTSTQRYSVEPKKPDKCTPGSTAPGCISYTSPSYTTTSRPQTTFSTSCYPGSPDPKCDKTTVTQKTGCYPGSSDPNCVKPVTPSKPKPACYPGSSDPKCARPTYLPPDTSTQRYTVEPGKTDKCTPGSTAPGCISYTSPSYTTTSRPQTTFSTSCYPGSPDPKCAKTTVTQKTGCYPGSPDPKCLKPVTPSKPKSGCYPGSTDPKCARPTYLPPDTSTQRYSVEPKKPDKCTPGSTAPECISYTSPSYTTTSRPQTTFSTSCYPGSPDPKCAKSSVTQKTVCYPGSPDPNCVKAVTPSKPKSACYPGSSDPKCTRPTYLPPDTSTQRYSVEPGNTDKCTPGSTAPECISYTSPSYTTTSRPQTTFSTSCYPGSPDPKCTKPTVTQKTGCYPGSPDPNCIKAVTPSKPKSACYPGSSDPKCTRPTYLPPDTSTQRYTVEPGKTYKCTPGSTAPECISYTSPSYTTTSRPQTTFSTSCYPGSPDPKCAKTTVTQKTGCYPGSPDPNCVKPVTPSKPKSACYPGSDDPKCARPTYLPPDTSTQRYSVEPKKPDKCTPGSTAPGCISYTSLSYTTTSRPQTPFSTSCYPGSTDPKCTKPTVTQKTGCYPGSPNPNCVKPVTPSKPKLGCYPGSSDPKCTRPTYLPPDTSTQRYSVEPGNTDKCTPGSTAPECISYTSPSYTTTSRPQTTFSTSCYPGSPDPKCAKTNVTQKTGCYPGSPDPKCLKPVTPSKPKSGCYPGSSDPKCARPTYLPPDTSTQRYSVEPSKPDKCTLGSKSANCVNYSLPYTTVQNLITPSLKSSTISPVVVTTSPSQTIALSSCYPGSPDPSCPQHGYIGTSRIPPTYLPPFEDNLVQRSIRHSEYTPLLKEINDLAFNNKIVMVDEDEHEIPTFKKPDRFKRSVRNNDLQYFDKNYNVDGTAKAKEIISITLNFTGFQVDASSVRN